MTVFEDLDLDPRILKSLNKLGYKEPTPIQAEAIPLILKGQDIIALAQTGSGKTAACAIPVCQRVDTERPVIQALIVVPTRELSLQYATELQKIGQDKGVKAFAILGGESMELQLAKLRHGVQAVIATPGRLIDLVYSRQIDLSHVETLILDEADEMLGMGFYDDLEFIIQCLVHDHQTLLFSATMPKDIRKIAQTHMNDPIDVILTQQASPQKITHNFLYCHHSDKGEQLMKLLNDEVGQAIIFCNSRRQVDKLCDFLKKQLKGVDLLHGGFSQDVRTVITNKFRSGKVRFMVATDVAARGLDFSGVTHVIIYDLSADVDTYVHRSGRTGRHDRHGIAVSLVTDKELRTVARIEKRIDREAVWLVPPPKAGARVKQAPRQEGEGRPPARRRRAPRRDHSGGSPTPPPHSNPQ